MHSLKLGGNDLRDENIPALVGCLNSMQSLTFLDLRSVSGISALSAAALFSCLKRNTSLETIKMWGVDETVIPALNNALCDKTSIGSIFNSNHTLSKVERLGSYLRPGDVESEIAPECKALLKMNEGRNKAEVARKKIIQYHFLEGNNLHELVDIGGGLMPRVLEGLGKNGLNVVYGLVRVLPSLFT